MGASMNSARTTLGRRSAQHCVREGGQVRFRAAAAEARQRHRSRLQWRRFGRTDQTPPRLRRSAEAGAKAEVRPYDRCQNASAVLARRRHRPKGLRRPQAGPRPKGVARRAPAAQRPSPEGPYFPGPAGTDAWSAT